MCFACAPRITTSGASSKPTPDASAAQQRDFLTHLPQTLNAPSHSIRNRLLRLTADSPDLLAIIKQEGRV